MANLRDILLLGDARLYQKAIPVTKSELPDCKPFTDKMADLIILFRKHYGVGRAIAAPQIGFMKRIIVVNIERPIVLFNPILKEVSKSSFELWDDCMSFPDLLVKVQRHERCVVEFKDYDWNDQSWNLEGGMSELIQHEYDHLNGILAIDRAMDTRSFRWRNSPES